MKFTIVTPSYSQGQFIEETIKSVLDQTGDFFIDYIIADGGSNDQTVETIKKYDELLKNNQYPIKCNGIEFRWWSKKDKGQSDAINQGFKIAEGEILAWINSDDYFLPGALQAVASKYREESFDFLYGNSLKIYEPNTKLVEPPKPDPNETCKSLLARTATFNQQATFFTKKITEQVGYLDETLHYCMDYDFWIKVFKVGKIKYLPIALGVFRLQKNSKTTTSQQKFNYERRLMAKRYGGNILTPKSVFRFIDSFRWRYIIKNKFPSFYHALKRIFFYLIDLLKYRTKN